MMKTHKRGAGRVSAWQLHKPGAMAVILFVGLLAGAFSAVSFAADKIVVRNAADTEDVFIVDDTGEVNAKRIGIATSNPQATFHTYETTTSATRGLLSAQHNNGAQGAYTLYRKSRGTESSPTAAAVGDYIIALDGQGYDGSQYQNTALVASRVDGAVSAGSVPTAIVLMTGSSIGAGRAERMRITSGGDVGIGTTAPAEKLYVVGNIYATDSITPGSSRALKENIHDLTSEEAVEALEVLNPTKFTYRTDPEEGHIGFIAEDVPELLATKDRKGVNTMDVVAVLTQVVKEQQRAMQDQQKVIAELTQKVNDLEQKVAFHGSLAMY